MKPTHLTALLLLLALAQQPRAAAQEPAPQPAPAQPAVAPAPQAQPEQTATAPAPEGTADQTQPEQPAAEPVNEELVQHVTSIYRRLYKMEDEFYHLLTTVRDRNSADDAAPRFLDLIDRMHDLAGRIPEEHISRANEPTREAINAATADLNSKHGSKIAQEIHRIYGDQDPVCFGSELMVEALGTFGQDSVITPDYDEWQQGLDDELPYPEEAEIAATRECWKKLTDILRQTADMLETITDRDGADAAAAPLRRLYAPCQDLADQLHDFEETYGTSRHYEELTEVTDAYDVQYDRFYRLYTTLLQQTPPCHGSSALMQCLQNM